MKIYIASSWRNAAQPLLVSLLAGAGHEVYDFRNPPGRTGFAWSDIDSDWQAWSADDFREMLGHPLARAGFQSDFDGMAWADVGVLLMPCGRSAHLELGWMAGAGKKTVVMLSQVQPSEPELMYKLASAIVTSGRELVDVLTRWEAERRAA